MSTSKIETWIKAGYELLGTEGLEGIKVERLARALNLNKSGYYHYFGTMEEFLKSLLQYHVHLAGEVAAEIARCETIDPDLLLLMVRRKSFFLVESQLLVKSRLAHTVHVVDEAGKIITNELLPLWHRNNDAAPDAACALAYLNIIRHFIYARIDADHVTYEFLHDLAVETQTTFEKVTTERHVSHDAGSSSSEL
jgi:AcrR family transcriptional regulator